TWTRSESSTLDQSNQPLILTISTGTFFATALRHETRRTETASLLAYRGPGHAHYRGARRTDRGHASALAASSLVVRRRERRCAHSRGVGVAAERVVRPQEQRVRRTHARRERDEGSLRARRRRSGHGDRISQSDALRGRAGHHQLRRARRRFREEG